MRIRSIKPEFWRSDDITALGIPTRLLFVGLWSYVDDNGVGIDDARRIVADLFALEDDQQEARDMVRDGLATLSRALLITRYSVSGKRFLHITNWEKHQKVDRPNKARYPLPEEAEFPGIIDVPDPAATSSREVRDTPSPGAVEQGSSGTGEQGTVSLLVPDERRITAKQIDSFFAEFWSVFPKKVAKLSAEKRFTILVKNGADPAEIIAGARAYRESRHGEDPQFTKQPDGWLNAGRWQDEPDPVVVPVGAGTKKAQGWLDIGNMALPEIEA